MSAGLRVERVTGAALEAQLDAIARLRIEVFRAFPYLYEGDLAYEARYLATYAQAPGAVVVLAKDGDAVVGASTGIPCAAETAEVRGAFTAAGVAPEAVFYLGESVLRAGYRGRGVGVRFFEEREAHARALGGLAVASFCAVERPADHPARPAGFVPLDAFWGRRGYTPTALRASFSWREVAAQAESVHSMRFWARALAPEGASAVAALERL